MHFRFRGLRTERDSNFTFFTSSSCLDLNKHPFRLFIRPSAPPRTKPSTTETHIHLTRPVTLCASGGPDFSSFANLKGIKYQKHHLLENSSVNRICGTTCTKYCHKNHMFRHENSLGAYGLMGDRPLLKWHSIRTILDTCITSKTCTSYTHRCSYMRARIYVVYMCRCIKRSKYICIHTREKWGTFAGDILEFLK